MCFHNLAWSAFSLFSIDCKSDVPLLFPGVNFLYIPTIQAPPKPILCCKAYFKPLTCLLSAIPLSCQFN